MFKKSLDIFSLTVQKSEIHFWIHIFHLRYKKSEILFLDINKAITFNSSLFVLLALLFGEGIHHNSNNFQCYICSEKIQSSKTIRILCKDQISNNDLTMHIVNLRRFLKSRDNNSATFVHEDKYQFSNHQQYFTNLIRI